MIPSIEEIIEWLEQHQQAAFDRGDDLTAGSVGAAISSLDLSMQNEASFFGDDEGIEEDDDDDEDEDFDGSWGED